MSRYPTLPYRFLLATPFAVGLTLTGCITEPVMHGDEYGTGGGYNPGYYDLNGNIADHDTLPTLWANYVNQEQFAGSPTGLQLLDDQTLVLSSFDYGDTELKLKLNRYASDGTELQPLSVDAREGYSGSYFSQERIRIENSIVLQLGRNQSLVNLKTGEVEWVADVPGSGDGFSGGIAAFDNPCPGDYTIRVIDPATGTAREVVKFPDNFEHSMPSILSATAVEGAGDEVYLATVRYIHVEENGVGLADVGTLLSIYTLDGGEPVWEYKQKGEYVSSLTKPITVNGLIVSSFGNDVVALNIENGAVAWTSSSTDDGRDASMQLSTYFPLIYDAGSSTIYALYGRELVAIDPATGSKRWSTSIGSEESQVTRVATVGGGLLAVSAGNGLQLLNAATGSEERFIPTLLGVDNYIPLDVIGDPENGRLYIYDGIAVYSVEVDFPVRGEQKVADTSF